VRSDLVLSLSERIYEFPSSAQALARIGYALQAYRTPFVHWIAQPEIIGGHPKGHPLRHGSLPTSELIEPNP
jgi:hypothetical protein